MENPERRTHHHYSTHTQHHYTHAYHNHRTHSHTHNAASPGRNHPKRERNKTILAAVGILLIITVLSLIIIKYTDSNEQAKNNSATGAEKNVKRTPAEKTLSKLKENIRNAEYAATYILNTNGKESELKLYFTKEGAAAVTGNTKRMLIQKDGKEILLECARTETEEWLCAQSIREDTIKTLLERDIKNSRWEKSIKVKGREAECFAKNNMLLCYDKEGKLVYAKNQQEKTKQEITIKKELPREEAEKETTLTEKEATEQPALPTGINDACAKCELLPEREREECYDAC